MRLLSLAVGLALVLAPAPVGPAPDLTLPEWERRIIVRVAAAHGVDPAALAAIRVIERGGPGREFGVLSVQARTYEAQAHVAAHSLQRATVRHQGPVYTKGFLTAFSERWAPVGVENDPTGLNRHHADNLLTAYHVLSRQEWQP